MKKTLEERFWAQVDKRQPHECWEWTGHKSHGYGYISVGSKEKGTRQELRANRVCWELGNGPIPPHRVIMHSCDNRACVNPAHLQLGTQSENIKDAFRKGRHDVPRLRGEELTQTKLTYEEVDAIRAAKGVITQKELGKMYGVCKAAISHIWTGRNWRI